MVEEIPRRNHTTACVFRMTAMMASGDDEFLERKTPNQNGTRARECGAARADLYILNNLAVVSIMHIG